MLAEWDVPRKETKLKMPRVINTYSKSRPTFRMRENDIFDELHQIDTRQANALDTITEADSSAGADVGVPSTKPFSRSNRVRRKPAVARPKSLKNKAPSWAPFQFPLKSQGTEKAKFSPIVASLQSSEMEDDSVILMSDYSEEGSTLCSDDPVITQTETCNDSCDDYSDIEVPRDLPVEKGNSRTSSNRILKLSQVSNVKAAQKPKGEKGKRTSRKPPHSTLLEGKLSALDLDQYEISEIPGNGAEIQVSGSSSSMLLDDLPCSDDQRKPGNSSRLVSVKKPRKGKQPVNKSKEQTIPTRSVYSLCSSDSDTCLESKASKAPEQTLSIIGQKASMQPRNSRKSQLQQSGVKNLSVKNAKKQVSFLLGPKPDVIDPTNPATDIPSHNYLPHLSPSASILRKSQREDKHLGQDEKTSRATSTPQKPSRHSRRMRGCHIMDLSFDISAVSLPSDSDLVIPPSFENKENSTKVQVPVQGSGIDIGETTEQLLDFEPLCLEASTHIGTLTEQSPGKGDNSGLKRGEMTPTSQVKRSSPDAETPSKRRQKKSRIINQDAKVSTHEHSRKRLQYKQVLPRNPIPECVITMLPFSGYKQSTARHSQPIAVAAAKTDVLETIPETVFVPPSSSVGCPS
ncbi:uncharacterized protein [Diadema setosum]|uniref:uncharacterized protein isoform X2 n=1 Tax=Diadema setosum TaxID=31175 RepID=UPI003B3A2A12